MKKLNLLRSFSKTKTSIFLAGFLLILFFAFSRPKAESKVQHTDNSTSIHEEQLADDELSRVDCLTAQIIRNFGCDPNGVDQATFNVRPNGDWDFMVHYCCNKRPSSCYKSGSGRSTAPGNIKHEEWSINSQTGCLELRNLQKY